MQTYAEGKIFRMKNKKTKQKNKSKKKAKQTDYAEWILVASYF